MESSRNRSDGVRCLKLGEYGIPDEVLDDLSSRFIINIPETERKDLIRVLFQIELAHWFFIDFYCKSGKPLVKSCGLREFAFNIFKHIPFLKPYVDDLDKIIEEWKDYKFSVPTYGAILLDEDLSHVLLVQSYWSKASWGFPKGKINKDEPPCHCAIREVLEETGFNITPHIDPDEYIEANIHEQVVRLYIIPGISKNTEFHPRTRNEIRAVSWFLLSDLPTNRKDFTLKYKTGINNNAFFMVSPFLRKLKQWILQHSHDPLRRVRRNRYKSCGDIETVFEISNDFIKTKDHNKFVSNYTGKTQEEIETEKDNHHSNKAIKSATLDTARKGKGYFNIPKNDENKNGDNNTTYNCGINGNYFQSGTDFNRLIMSSHPKSIIRKLDDTLISMCMKQSGKHILLPNTFIEPKTSGKGEAKSTRKEDAPQNLPTCRNRKESNDFKYLSLQNSDLGRLSERIRNLEIKPWINFRFNKSHIFN